MVSGSVGSKFASSGCDKSSPLSSLLDTDARGMSVVVVVVDIVSY